MNLDDLFHVWGISSVAETESLDSYKSNIDYYRKNAYSYIPIPDADKYSHVPEGELRDLDENQYYHPDLPMMAAFERLQEHPFLIHDSFMRFEIAGEEEDRIWIPDGEKTYDIKGESLTPCEIVEDSETILDSLSDEAGFERRTVEDILDRRDNRYYIVTLADVNKRRARELFYHVVSEFEIQLAHTVKENYPESLIEEANEEEIERWYRSRLDNLEMHIAENMYLSTLLKVAGKDKDIRSKFGFSSRNKFDDALGGLNDLRHKVMHPTRAIVHDRDDLEKQVNRVKRVQDALETLGRDQIQPDYPHITEQE